MIYAATAEAGCGVVGGEKLAKKSEEGGWKEGVIRMVRKRWRGVAPYFYTVWPLLCIIPHLARSSRDAGSRYADLLLHAENPNLPSVSPFRQMMDDAGRPTGTLLVSLLLWRRTRSSRNDERIMRRSFRDALSPQGEYVAATRWIPGTQR